jgi:hypothetical protein
VLNNQIPFDYAPPVAKKPRKYPVSPELHEKIRKLYQGLTGDGQVNAFARRIGYPRWKISRYALQNGWVARQNKELNWSDAEIRILKNNAQYTPEIIQRRLKQAGHRRSLAGIILKRKRLRMLQNLKGESARSLSYCLVVDVHVIRRAILSGKLKADKRGTARTDAQGGDIWYIKTRDIREYITENLCEIDFRKVDKYWMVDILTGKGF